MPELPEVETIRLGLSRKIIGLKIKNIEILENRSFFGNSNSPLGKTILNIWRRAKILGIELDNKLTILFHLKMSGQLILVKPANVKERFIGGHPTLDMFSDLPNNSTRVIFTFNDGQKLYFNDQRKFGWVKVFKSSELGVQSFLKTLGPEPLDKSFTTEILKKNLLKHKSQPVKVALLDQTIVSGIGNIYACEACFNSGIDPRKKISELEDLEFKKLHQGIIKALSDGIKYGGSTRTHFVNEEGKKGYFLDHAFIYGKDGSQCKICGTEIKKLKLGGRGTYFCPKCQS